MIITAKQKELIALLIDEAMSDRPALERRWNLPAAVPFAQSRAREGFLLPDEGLDGGCGALP